MPVPLAINESFGPVMPDYSGTNWQPDRLYASRKRIPVQYSAITSEASVRQGPDPRLQPELDGYQSGTLEPGLAGRRMRRWSPRAIRCSPKVDGSRVTHGDRKSESVVLFARSEKMAIRYLTPLLLLAVLIPPLCGIPVSSINVADLTTRSDLIVLGRLVSVAREGTTVLDYVGSPIPAERYLASIAVDHAIKGTEIGTPLPVVFAVATTGLGYPDVVADSYGVFFLKRGKHSYEFTDRWYPSLPAVEGWQIPSGSALDQVTYVLGLDLESSQLTDQSKGQVLEALGRLHTERAAQVLGQALGNAAGDLRLHIARVLVARNEIAGFAAVEEALLHPSTLSKLELLNLAASLGGLRDSRTVPGLTMLAESTDPTVRRYAAKALRQSGSSAAVAPLTKLLNDSDFNTRYEAVAGLGEITGQDEWTPAVEEFKQHEYRYVTYWRQWAQSNRN